MKHLYFLTALAALTSAQADLATSAHSLEPIAMDSYRQTILVTFRSEGAARAARLHIAPLYHDLRAAFSTRMDDCNLNDLRVAEVMGKYAQKGTFYLNDPKSWWQDSTETGVAVAGDPAEEVPKRLLEAGNSIGDHTLSHEMLPALSKNNAFREILGDRITLETRTASPVVSFVYPFVFFKSELRDGTDRTDLEEIIRRSGFYQLAEHKYNEDWDSGLQDGLFVTCDADNFSGKYSESILDQARGENDRPLFLVTMHAWVKQWGGPEYPILADIYKRRSGRADWWYCNQNQYAAYRYQAQHARLATFVEGRVLKAILTRPDPLDLGDGIPLTFRVDGVNPEEILSVESPGAEVKPAALTGSYAFDLSHAQKRGAIERYTKTDNPGNADRLEEVKSGADGLCALLYRKGNILTLTLRNDGERPLQDIRVVFRLPLRWEEGVVRKQVGTLAGKADTILTVPLTERAAPGHYSDGLEYNVAQVDFSGERRVRLYATCEVPGGEPPAFFARNGFWMLGPLAGDVAGFGPSAFAKAFLEGQPPQRQYAVPWDQNLAWRTLEPTKAAILDPDIIPTSGKSNVLQFYKDDNTLYFPHARVHYVLYGRIVSPEERIVRAVFNLQGVKYLSLNGQKVEGRDLVLRKGANDLRILYTPAPGLGSSFDETNYGCYFRLMDGEGRRVEDVRFERPAAP